MHLVWGVARGAGGDFLAWSCRTSSLLALPISGPMRAKFKAPLLSRPHPWHLCRGRAAGPRAQRAQARAARGLVACAPVVPKLTGAAPWLRSGFQAGVGPRDAAASLNRSEAVEEPSVGEAAQEAELWPQTKCFCAPAGERAGMASCCPAFGGCFPLLPCPVPLLEH